MHKYLTGTTRSDLLVDMVTFLLDNGANVHDTYDSDELTPLHLVAANVLFTDLIEIMVSNYEADVDIHDKNGRKLIFLSKNGIMF